MTNQFQVLSEQPKGAVIKVIGVGGGGCNAVDYMVDHGVLGVEFIAVNTDLQTLERSKADRRINLGAQTTRGLGAGSDPAVGVTAAKESEAELREILADTDMLFITAGMGGGTGTGAAPVLARIANDVSKERDEDLLCVGVVCRPFDFEGRHRTQVADKGIEELLKHVDSLIVIHNQRLTTHKTFKVTKGFNLADEVLHGAVRGVAELITRPGMINVDFADVRATMKSAGTTIIGSGSAIGSDAAQDAINNALSCPLLEDYKLERARGILCNITANEDCINMDDFETIGNHIKNLATADAKIIMGLAFDNSLEDEMRVTVVATGLCGKTPARGEEYDDNGWTRRTPSTATDQESELRVVENGKSWSRSPDYSKLVEPAIIRKQAD